MARRGAVRSEGAEGRKDRRRSRKDGAVVSAVIGASHVLCSIGSGTDQVWAAARTGIGRIVSSDVMDRYFDPIKMALVPEDSLPPVNMEIDELPLPPRARRMLRLAT